MTGKHMSDFEGWVFMGIDFSASRWDTIRKNFNTWWKNKLDRPIVQYRVPGRDPGRPCPDAPSASQENCHDLSISADDLIDRLDYDLSCFTFLGDDFPSIKLNFFGPVVLAAMSGADIDNSSGKCWYHPKEFPIQEIHLKYNPDNRWLNRLRDICRAAIKRWQGQVLVQMPVLGGNFDSLACFMSTEDLLIALYDYPEEVFRLLDEEHNLFFRYYDEFNELLTPWNPGYSDWSNIYSEKPNYILQSDFSYMISPELFDKYVKPGLTASVKRINNSFYHLDGVGELPHLDSILTIEELCGVQWIPGAGRPQICEWPEVLQKIVLSGKKLQTIGGLDILKKSLDIVSAVAPVNRMVHWGFQINSAAAFRKKMDEMGIDTAASGAF